MKDFFDELPANVKSFVLEYAQPHTFNRGDFIYRSGDKPKGLYFVESGLVGLIIIGSSGKEHLTRFYTAKNFFGHRSLFAEQKHHAFAQALEKTKVLLLSKEHIEACVLKNPDLSFLLLKKLSIELGQVERQHVAVLENQILSRIALALVYLKDLYPDYNWTRQEIANFCASTTSTVIKTMAELEESGLIQQDGRTFRVLNRDALIHLQEK